MGGFFCCGSSRTREIRNRYSEAEKAAMVVAKENYNTDANNALGLSQRIDNYCARLGFKRFSKHIKTYQDFNSLTSSEKDGLIEEHARLERRFYNSFSGPK